MTQGTSYLWPEGDDRAVVEDMLRDPRSERWYECREFVKKRVQIQAKNITQDHWDDLIQETMLRIQGSLSTFHYHCRLSTWIVGIIRNCIIDDYRKSRRSGQAPLSFSTDDHEENELTTETIRNNHGRTVEDECIVHDELRNALKALSEYILRHAHKRRNSIIIQMVIIEHRTLEEAAQAAGCSAPVAGYIVRSAQRFAREKVRNQP